MIKRSDFRSAHIAPHTLAIASMFSVMSRLKPSNKCDNLTKMKIYKAVRDAMGIKETKEAPRGTYFTKTGNLVKGRLTKAAKARGARETAPKDKMRSKVPPVTQRNPDEAAGVGIITKQNTTKDVNKKTLSKMMKALRLIK